MIGACHVKSLAYGPGKVMHWVTMGNNEILEGRASFLSGAQLEGRGGLE